MARFGAPLVTLSFLTVGVQTLLNAAAGGLRMPLRRYTPAAIVGSLLWAGLYTTAGFAILEAIRGALPWWSLVGAVVAGFVFAQVGLQPDRLILLEGGDEKTVLACFEEGLRHGGLGAVVAEVARLPMTASRRLQLAAEGKGAIGIALRRWRRQSEAVDFGQPTAAVTRWRVTALPSTPLPAPGVGRPRWLVELIRCRAGESADFELEACDGKGRLSLPSEVANRPPSKEIERDVASA